MSFFKLFGLVFLLSVILVFRFVQFYHSNPTYHEGQEVSLTITLQAEPTLSSGGQKFTIRTLADQLISVTADATPAFHYGQVVTITGRLQAHTFTDGQTILSLYHPSVVLMRDSDNAISAAANRIKSHTETVYNTALPEIPANLLWELCLVLKNNFRLISGTIFKQPESCMSLQHRG
jgi:hypothetical protein